MGPGPHTGFRPRAHESKNLHCPSEGEGRRGTWVIGAGARVGGVDTYELSNQRLPHVVGYVLTYQPPTVDALYLQTDVTRVRLSYRTYSMRGRSRGEGWSARQRERWRRRWRRGGAYKVFGDARPALGPAPYCNTCIAIHVDGGVLYLGAPWQRPRVACIIRTHREERAVKKRPTTNGCHIRRERLAWRRHRARQWTRRTDASTATGIL